MNVIFLFFNTQYDFQESRDIENDAKEFFVTFRSFTVILSPKRKKLIGHRIALILEVVHQIKCLFHN